MTGSRPAEISILMYALLVGSIPTFGTQAIWRDSGIVGTSFAHEGLYSRSLSDTFEPCGLTSPCSLEAYGYRI